MIDNSTKDNLKQENPRFSNTLLSAVKLAYKQYKSDLDFVKNKSNVWKNKPYTWGLTHWSIAIHCFYWFVIRR